MIVRYLSYNLMLRNYSYKFSFFFEPKGLCELVA